MPKACKELVAKHFPLFSAKFKTTNFHYMLAQQIGFYCKDKLAGDAEKRKDTFFGKVKRDTGTKRPSNSRTRDRNSTRTYESFVTNIREGDAASDYILLLYYWLHIFPEDHQYAEAIDKQAFRASHGKAAKAYEVQFSEDVPGKQEIWALLGRAFQPSPHAKPKNGKDETENLTDKAGAAGDDAEAPVSSRTDKLEISGIQSKPWQPPEYRPQIHFDESQWLSPENPNGIPFVAREEEMARLDSFISDEKTKFQIWAIVAPSGAGKTRLTTEWMRSSDNLKDWRKCVLKPHHRDDEGWKDWQPDKPTVLVIDYIHGFEGLIRNLINKFSDNEPLNPVKMLVLDHIFPDDFEDIRKFSRWGLSESSGTGIDRVSQYFYNKTPMLLDEADDLERIILGVIAKVAGKNDDDQSVKDAADYLRKEKGAWHPLFAALVGFALSKQEVFSDYSEWNRRQLIHYYLNGADRLPWRHGSADSIWASCFIVVATLRRGVDADLLMEYVPVEGRLAPTSKKAILDLCNPVISSPDRLNLPPFEPDVLGESFFLLFLEHCLEPTIRGHFMQMLSAGGGPPQADDAGEFAGVLQRLARNLSNDNQETGETKNYWRQLLNFLTQDRFPAESPFRWSVAIACFEIFRMLQDKELPALADQFLRQVKADDLYVPQPEKFGTVHIISALRYFEASRKGSDAIPPLLEALLASHDPQKSGGNTTLMMASEVGSLPVVDHLIDIGAAVDAANDERWTALMIACRSGQEAVALRLLEKCKNLDAANDERWTALMFACRNDQEIVALRLLEKCENLDAANCGGMTALMFACGYDQEVVALRLLKKCKNLDAANDKGWTALMFACRSQEAVALRLLEKCKNSDAANGDGWTALMVACRYSQEAVVFRLLEKCKNPDAASDDGWTALLVACCYSQEAVALRLLEKCKNLDAANDKGWTALIFACRSQEAVALRLLETCKNPDAASDDGWTALMVACRYSQEAVALRLLEKCKNLDAANDEHWTALMFACRYDQEAVVLMLIEKGVNINQTDKGGITVLMHACFNDCKSAVRLLINRHVKLDNIWENGEVPFTALGLARSAGHQEIVEMLEKVGALDLPLQ